MIKNKDKILQELKEIKRTITTTELAEKTGIDITNISRYTKALESEGFIERNIEQRGKIRLVNISLLPEKKPIKENVPEKTQPKTRIEDLKPPGPPQRIKEDLTEIPKNIEDKLLNLVQRKFNELVAANFNVAEINIEKEMNTSDYIREKYLKITGKTWRGTNEGCKEELKKFHVIKDPNFSEVVEELKKILIPSNTNLIPSKINGN